MRVKLCARCPYSPRDVADHYDPASALHLCERCDRNAAIPKICRKVHGRERCAIAPDAFSAAQRTAAPSVAESLV